MKCVCGYEGFIGDKGNDFNQVDIGKVINGCFIKQETRIWWLEYQIYVCPKCGTLKIDVEETE